MNNNDFPIQYIPDELFPKILLLPAHWTTKANLANLSLLNR